MSAIKAGDLVVLVRSCTGKYVGAIFRVSHLKHKDVRDCYLCGGDHPGLYAAADAPFCGKATAAPVAWLKTIDPLAEPESIDRKEEIPA